MERFSIEEMVERFGITPRTLHYYEEIGLLENVPRTDGGHRFYTADIVARLEHILKLKDLLGMSLQEIREMMEAEDRLEEIRISYRQEASSEEKARLVEQAAVLLETQVGHMDEKIEKLRSMREGFAQRLERVRQIMSKGNDPG